MREYSISRKIVFRTTIIIIALWLIGTILAAINIRHEIAETLDAALQQTAQRSVPLAIAYLSTLKNGDTVVTGGMPDDDEYLMYQVRKAGGPPLLRSLASQEAPFPAPLKRGFWDDANYRYYTEPAGDSGLFIQVAEPKYHRNEAWVESATGLLYPILILIPACLLGIWASVRQGITPLKLFRKEIITRGHGNLEAIELPRCPTELTPIVAAVNSLLTRLHSALDAERAFSSNSAHELRTPVATALAQTQQLISELPKDTPAYERGKKVEMALKRLARLSEKLLQLARADAGIGISEEPQALGDATKLVLEDFAHDPKQAERLRFAPPSFIGLTARIDTDAYAICLRNLIENALAHGDPDGAIDIWCTEKAVHVANDCPPLTPDALQALTKRFARNGNSTSQGTGLGLAIVEAIIESAGGKLEMISPRPGTESGFEARLILP
ncbi:sensor histidine kinase [Aestuariispira ectoiniformans]|uniref:sensor histidine kinase n=1 Tax=Aestuariispira ectoiniformans TaxID=2775080 RepID=UPI00223BD129|nr:ATP-binding protein [Aestuariispira ectoiniformans]